MLLDETQDALSKYLSSIHLHINMLSLRFLFMQAAWSPRVGMGLVSHWYFNSSDGKRAVCYDMNCFCCM